MPEQDITRYIVNPDVSCREEDADGALLFNPDTDEVLVVNATGALLWQALAEPRRLADLLAVLSERCDHVPADQVAADVSEFLERMVARGFIGVYEGGNG